MIVFFCSLDSTFAQAKQQGNLEVVTDVYRLFGKIDNPVVLTQDVDFYCEGFQGITHVPCGYSRYRLVRKVLSRFKILRWVLSSYNGFFWLMRNRNEVSLLISENADSPTPWLFTSLFAVPHIVRYHYDLANQMRYVSGRFFESVLIFFIEKLSFTSARKVWITGPNLYKTAKIIGAKSITFIPNWVDFRKTSTNSHALITQRKDVLFVGRLHPVKRVNLLIEAFGRLKNNYPSKNLVIIGNGEEMQNLNRLVNDLKLSASVKFLGFQNHAAVLNKMSKAEMIVLPSVTEGNPRVLIEAMMMKVPIVATNVPGIKDIVRQGQTGHLINQASSQDLSIAMEYIINNPEYVSMLTENAFKFARENFSAQAVLEKIEQDLKDLSIFEKYTSRRVNL